MAIKPYLLRPEDIEKESFRIIKTELGQTSFNTAELTVAMRIIHATGDVCLAEMIRFHPQAIDAGIRAIRTGKDILVDVNMVAAGIDKKRLSHFGGKIICHISNPAVSELARLEGRTRADVAIEMGMHQNIGMVAIGNAPTALLRIIEIMDRGANGAMIAGVPVGFVNASESKDALSVRPYPFITVLGRKGGSTVAAAIVNALLRLAEKKT